MNTNRLRIVRPGRANNRQSARRTHRKQLRVEQLEDRRLLSTVGYWRFDHGTPGTPASETEGILDYSGNNLHGSALGGPVYRGVIGSVALEFDGANDRVIIEDDPRLQLTESLTLEATLRIDSYATSGVIVWRGDDRSGLDPYAIKFDGDDVADPSHRRAIEFFLQPDGGTRISLYAPAPPLGEVFHVAGTLDDATGECKLFINGVAVAETTTEVRPFAELDPSQRPRISIGNIDQGGTQYFGGIIDEVRISDMALNPSHFTMPLQISISDAAAVEGGESYSYTGPFVTPDMYGLAASRDLRVGPDGHVYVASHDTDSVKVFHPATAQYLGELTTPGGELDGPWAMAFGPDGHLYVSGRYSSNIVRFDVMTGVSSVFVASGSGGLEIPWGIAFGPNGDLFASSRNDNGNYTITEPIKRYSGATGTYLGDFVVEANEAFAGITFGPDGNLYAAARTSDSVRHYDGQTGVSLGVFVPGGDTNPSRLEFHAGKLYVSDHSSSSLYRYDATTGAFADLLAATVGNSVSGFAFGSDDVIYASLGTPLLQPGSQVVQFAPSRFAAFAVSLNYASSATVTVDYSTVSDTAISGSDFVGDADTLTFAPGETTRTVFVQTLDDMVHEPSETFHLVLSGAVGATIADDTGIGTISDNDLAPTKFYVVNDASANTTYEYDAAGNPIENYSLDSGNSSPRGAASTAAGDTVWVADKNRKVYVYDDAGGLQGSWSAGTLSSRAKVEGVATDGTDVWIVDDYANRVYRYANAAGRLSGSQNAASNFALDSGNKYPKGIVTDGTHIWVVNDASTDKVFKYTTSGSLVGSWTIDSANKYPKGLTIDPSGASQDIWIVDSGTDKVYQYVGAKTRISGSQAADAVFALAAGNTNPQGIADPPPGAHTPRVADSAPTHHLAWVTGNHDFGAQQETAQPPRRTATAIRTPRHAMETRTIGSAVGQATPASCEMPTTLTRQTAKRTRQLHEDLFAEWNWDRSNLHDASWIDSQE